MVVLAAPFDIRKVAFFVSPHGAICDARSRDDHFAVDTWPAGQMLYGKGGVFDLSGFVLPIDPLCLKSTTRSDVPH